VGVWSVGVSSTAIILVNESYRRKSSPKEDIE
jgi:hypothetical protein